MCCTFKNALYAVSCTHIQPVVVAHRTRRERQEGAFTMTLHPKWALEMQVGAAGGNVAL